MKPQKKYSDYLKKSLIMLLSLCSIAYAGELHFIAFGDQPYGPINTLEALISRIDESKESQFSIHVGDIKAGSSRCDTEYFIKIKNAFNRAEKPLIYTPGDNEWTDCHRGNNGGYEPTERLNALREVFFSNNESFGKQKIILKRQSEVMPKHARYVENRRWTTDGILFITINQPGSNNNRDSKIPGALEEYAARNQANMAWLKDSFRTGENSEAIVVAMQSDTNVVTDEEFGFGDFLNTIAVLSKEYKKPILIIQGDTHEYIVDQSIHDEKDHPIQNVLRLVVPGAKKVQAIEVTVKPQETNILKVFTFNPISLH